MPDRPSDNARHVVYRLGWVSLLNDLGSEVLARLVPLYVAGVLGAPMKAVGAIEGVADSTSTLLKPMFGTLSDRLRARKPFVLWGYGLSSLARPLLAAASIWPFVGALRFLDRLGKGVRTAPRDALIADSGASKSHGRNFGINRAMDTSGALLGVLAFAAWTWHSHLAQLTHASWTGLVIACSVPGFAAAALVWLGVAEPRKIAASKVSAPLLAPPDHVRLDPLLKRYLAIIGLFCLANSSDAFVLLRAKELGYSLPEILGVVALLNVVSAATAIPAAALSDRYGRRLLIVAGWLIYAASYLAFGSALVARHPAYLAAAVTVYGLFFGFTEGVERAWIADLAPARARGRAFGWYGLVSGISALPASLCFGWLWDAYGSHVPFFAAAGLALAAAALLLLFVRPPPQSQGH